MSTNVVLATRLKISARSSIVLSLFAETRQEVKI